MSFLAVVVGYLGTALIVMVTFSLAYLILGAEGSYQPDSWNVSMTWVVLSIVVGLGAAWTGGRICIWIAGNHVAPKYLVALIVVLGVVSAMMTNQGDVDTIRTVTPSIMEAMSYSVQPAWLTWLNPVLGGVGVAMGSGLLFGSDRGR